MKVLNQLNLTPGLVDGMLEVGNKSDQVLVCVCVHACVCVCGVCVYVCMRVYTCTLFLPLEMVVPVMS